MRGLVTKSTGSWYTILLEGESIQARLRGSLRLTDYSSTAPVVVGDLVEVTQNSTGEWTIDSVEERRNYLVRKSTNLSRQRHIIAANIDHLYVVCSLSSPATPLEFIDRVLVGAECYGVSASILVNKSDISPPSAYFRSIYERAGYSVRAVSAVTGLGVEDLRGELSGRTVLFSGNSGVGKSSLINALDPSLGARTGSISSYHGKGRHTTTFSEIFALSGGGFLIDTPGIKGFGFVEVDNRELGRYFPEFLVQSVGCGFYNCTHTHEPDCGVIRAVECGLVSVERYDSYVKMLVGDGKYRQ